MQKDEFFRWLDEYERKKNINEGTLCLCCKQVGYDCTCGNITRPGMDAAGAVKRASWDDGK